jgi:hypothetical protein
MIFYHNNSSGQQWYPLNYVVNSSQTGNMLSSISTEKHHIITLTGTLTLQQQV